MATARPSAIIDELLAAVDYLRISVDDPGAQWVACADLLGDPSELARVVGTTMAERGTDRADVATSLFVQGYVFRIATVAIGSWLLADAVLDIAPQRTQIAIGRGQVNAVNLTAESAVDDATVTDLHGALIDGHLAALVDVAHRSCRVGEPLLWGNVAGSCAAAFSAFAAAVPGRRSLVRDRAELFFATARSDLGEAGRLVRVGSRFSWERNSCCLWYRTASAWLCEDCSLRPSSDRRQRYAAMLAEEDPDARA